MSGIGGKRKFFSLVPEWGGQAVDFKLEEDAFFDGTSVRFIDGRQTRFHLVPRARVMAAGCEAK